MDDRTLQVFAKVPDALPLYCAVEAYILAHFPDVTMDVKKTQVTFLTKYGFAYAWPPVRRVKGRPPVYLMLSFLLDRQVVGPRIAEAAQPRPNRWIHHLVVADPRQLDDEVLGWLRQAHAFSLRPGPVRTRREG